MSDTKVIRPASSTTGNDTYLIIRREKSTIFLDVNENDTILDIKRELEPLTGKRASQMMLVLGTDTELENNRRLFDYDITHRTSVCYKPTELGLCFMQENGQFEPLNITPYSEPVIPQEPFMAFGSLGLGGPK